MEATNSTRKPFVKEYWADRGQISLHSNDAQKNDSIETELIDFPLLSEADFLNVKLNKPASLSNIVFSAYVALLYRYSPQPVVGVGILRNDHIVPCETQINGDICFQDLIQNVELSYTDSFNNDGRHIAEEPDNYRCIIIPEISQTPFNHSPLSGCIYDLALSFYIVKNKIFGRFSYNSNQFEPLKISILTEHFGILLRGMLKKSMNKIGDISMLTDLEARKLSEFNDTVEPYANTKTLHQLFEDQVAITPDHIALYFGNEIFSYKQLNERSNQLARALIMRGIKKGDNIALLVSRNFDMIIGMLAILKAGGTYVPVDPDYPEERQLFIIVNSAVKLVLTDREILVTNFNPIVNFINFNSVEYDLFDKNNLELEINSKQLAYTIYTSGSTGQPKGVMIEHHSAVNLVSWVNKTFNISSDDRLLFVTSMCFDLSVYDVFGVLAAGAGLVIASQAEINNFNQLQLMLQRYQITFWDSVPSTLDYLIRELEAGDTDFVQNSLRLVFLSGDWIPVKLPNKIKKHFPSAKVISLGGATEATVWSNYYPIEEMDETWKSVPYGRPIDNNFFYILNDQLQPVPIGVIGNLFIGGVGVAKGYINDPVRTTASFVKDPFNDCPDGMMYRTGDLGRMLPDMNMEFLGRVDNQVKIRGFRVELGEIESALHQILEISQAVVLAKVNHDSKKYLVGYVVVKNVFNKDDIITQLQTKLPHYMIPLLWIQMEALPLNINGKIDRNELANIELPERKLEIKDKTVLSEESIMKDIWEDVFDVKDIAPNNNFFELGGDSLDAVQILSRFQSITGRRITIGMLFKNPTIASLASAIGKNDLNSKWKSLVPIKPSGTKTPLYIVHGNGLYAVGFNELAKNVDPEQPVYGLQPKELDEIDSAIETMDDIAKIYLDEILLHNPKGPYAIAGYSFGGFIAIEMARQLVEMGKTVKMVGIFDTNSENCIYNKSINLIFWRKMIRQIPKFFWVIGKSVIEPAPFLAYHYNYYAKKFKTAYGRITKGDITDIEKIRGQILEENQNYYSAWKSYVLKPVTSYLYLFKAKDQFNYADDLKSLGWFNYAENGLKVFEIPGDHNTILHKPNVKEFALVLQNVLDNC